MKNKLVLLLAFSIALMSLPGCGSSSGGRGNYSDEMKIESSFSLHDDGADAFERDNDHKQSPYYAHIDFYNMEAPTDTMVLLPHFKTFQQTSWWSCGLSALMMVMNYYDRLGDWNEKSLYELAGDHSAMHDGLCTDQLLEIAEAVGGFDIESTYDFIDDLSVIDYDFVYKYIDSGVPLIIGWNDWGGHWEVIIGYDKMGTDDICDDVLIIADPYDSSDHNQDGYGIISADRFICNYTFYDFFGDEQTIRDKCFIALRPAA